MNDNPRSLDRLPVRLRNHPRVGHDRDIGEPVRAHERRDRRDHRGRLRLVALERLHHQREPGRIGEQTDGDLRIQPALLGEPRLPKPIPGIGLVVQRGDVVEDQRCRSQRRVRRAGGRHPCACRPRPRLVVCRVRPSPVPRVTDEHMGRIYA